MSLLSSLGKGIVGAVTGFVTGGPAGAVLGGAGALIGGARSGAQNNPVPAFTPAMPAMPQLPPLQGFTPQQPTMADQIKQGLGTVGDWANYLLGQGKMPLTSKTPTPAPVATGGGLLQMGMAPATRTQTIRRCGRGYALAVDGRCYPRVMLPRSLRAWKPEPRPVVSRTDQKAIRRADRARHRLVKLTKDSGAFASMHKPHVDHKRKR